MPREKWSHDLSTAERRKRVALGVAALLALGFGVPMVVWGVLFDRQLSKWNETEGTVVAVDRAESKATIRFTDADGIEYAFQSGDIVAPREGDSVAVVYPGRDPSRADTKSNASANGGIAAFGLVLLIVVPVFTSRALGRRWPLLFRAIRWVFDPLYRRR